MPFTGPKLLEWVSLSRNTSHAQPSWDTVEVPKKALESPTGGYDSELSVPMLGSPGTLPGPRDERAGRC